MIPSLDEHLTCGIPKMWTRNKGGERNENQVRMMFLRVAGAELPICGLNRNSLEGERCATS